MQRLMRFGLALSFAAATLTYGVFWAYAVHWQIPVSVGFAFEDESLHIASIEPDGPADLAGLRPLDRVVAIDESEVETQLAVIDSLRTRSPETHIRVTVNLAGLNRLRAFYATLAPAPANVPGSWLHLVALEIVRAYPVLFLLLVSAVLVRVFDRGDAWLMALGLSGVLVAWAPLPFENVTPDLRGITFAFKTMLGGLGPAVLFYFFTAFPARSPLDEWEPRIKEWFVAASALVVVPATLWVLASPEVTQGTPGRIGFWLGAAASVAALVGIVISFVGNIVSPPSSKEVPRIELVTFGGLVALAPGLLLGIVMLALPRPVTSWLTAPILMLTLLLPITLGYVMTSRRVPAVPDLLQEIGRFVLIRRGRFVVLGCIGLGFAIPLSEWLYGLLNPGTAALIVALVFGTALVAGCVWGGSRLYGRVSERVDRALFSTERTPAAVPEQAPAGGGTRGPSNNG